MRSTVSKIATAFSRVTAILDVDEALQAVLDEARSISAADCGVLVTLEDAGGVNNVVTSGFTPAEFQRIWTIPQGTRMLAELNEIEDPVSIRNLSSWFRSRGLLAEDLPTSSFLGAPMRYQGRRVGNIFLGRKGNYEGNNFTQADEEILGMFADHAAVVVTNARQYEEERRAKAEMEALIDSAPLGVLVFDAKTGHLLSVNEETRRIVGGMHGRGHALDVLLNVLTFRRPDGRELGFDELPLTRALTSGETVRAEEIVISHADGPAVTTLVNARPIYSDDGEIVSVVATLQDMSPLEDVERQRTEFLGMVSRRLRTPLSTIKGSTATVLGSSSPVDPAEMRQFFQIIDTQADRMRELTKGLIDVSRIDTGSLSISPRPTDVAAMLDEAMNAFRGIRLKNPLSVSFPEELSQVAADQPRMVQVLRNLLDCAFRLSAVGGAICMTASQTGSHAAISITTQAKDISDAQLPYLFNKLVRIDDVIGSDDVTELGLSLAICKGIVEAHGGRIWADRDGPERSLKFTLTIPLVIVDEDVDGSRVTPDLLTPAAKLGATEQAAILSIDSDPRMLTYVRNILSEAGYAPMQTGYLRDAERLIAEDNPRLIIVDATLLRNEDSEFMSRMTAITNAPMIVQTERERDEDITMAFEMGAADYIVKPYSPNELVARVKVALRSRTVPEALEPLNVYELGDLSINDSEHRVTLAGRPIQLSATEYRLLMEFAINAGKVLTHDHLLQKVWGENYIGDSQLLRTYVKYLRNKLGDSATDPKYLFTEPRVGYRMIRPELQNQSSMSTPDSSTRHHLRSFTTPAN